MSASLYCSPSKVIARIEALSVERRCIVALAGPPGCGKSTFAEALSRDLNIKSPGSAAVVPMDGFHYDDAILLPLGLRPKKGSPETFDVAGFAHMIGRLAANTEKEIAVPVFDRALEIARAGARLISRSVQIVIVEGNYLLLDKAPWNGLGFDLTVMIKAERRVLRERLLRRWLDLGASEDEASYKVDHNDMRNVDLIEHSCRPADLNVRM